LGVRHFTVEERKQKNVQKGEFQKVHSRNSYERREEYQFATHLYVVVTKHD
jgi:hypothetical protein